MADRGLFRKIHSALFPGAADRRARRRAQRAREEQGLDGFGAVSAAGYARHLHGLDADMHGLEADLRALEHAVAYGDLGADAAAIGAGVGAGAATVGGAGVATLGVGGATAAGAGYTTAVGGAALLSTGAATGAGAAATVATGSAAVGTGALLAVAAAPVVGVGATAAWLASYRATTGNVRRLKAKIAKLRRKILDTKRIYGKTSPNVAKRRIRWYERQIRMARRRLDRIERVMKRRIERRERWGWDVSDRQKRLMRALKRRGRPVVSLKADTGAAIQRVPVAQQEALVAQADAQEVRVGLPAIAAGLSVVAVRAYVDRALPIARDLVAQGQPVELAAQQAVQQVSPPAAYYAVTLRRVTFWLRRDSVPQRFQPSAASVGVVGPGYQSGAFQPFPSATVIPGGPFAPYGPAATQAQAQPFDEGAEGAEGADADAEGADAEMGAEVGELAPWYKRPGPLLALAAVIGGGWYFTQGQKGQKGQKA